MATSLEAIVKTTIAAVDATGAALVLEDGEMVGLGTHDELLRTCPTYIEIVESQTGEAVPA